MKLNSICAIIVTYNCDKNFYSCFASVYNAVSKVVIVDNGSREETLSILYDIKKKFDIELILNKENLGIASALNKGANYAIENNFDWIITLDHDSKLTNEMIGKMLNTYYSIGAEERNKIASIVPIYLEESMVNNTCYLNKKDKYEYIENGITSGNIVKVSVIRNIGFCEEKLFIDYVDYDFCCKLIEHGYKIIQVNEAILLHNLGETKRLYFFGKKVEFSNHSYIRRYYITRNRLFVWNRYKNITPNFIKLDKISSIKELVKIILFEKDKLLKLRMILKGYHDYKNNIYGKINI